MFIEESIGLHQFSWTDARHRLVEGVKTLHWQRACYASVPGL